jgi:hypothetical protein
LVLFLAQAAMGALSVGPGGLAPQTFDELPPADEWAWQSIVGNSGFIVSVAGLDLAVQTNAAGRITNQLVNMPSATPFGAAAWNSTEKNIYTGPAGIAAQLLMATLRNDSGGEIHVLPVAYDFGVATFVAPEEVPGHRAFFSLTGASNSWQLIPEFSGKTNAGSRDAVLDLGTWAAGAPLYILWAQDNSSRSPDTCYSIDNFHVPIGDPFPPRLAIERIGGDGVRVTWTGGGILQFATSLAAPPVVPIQWNNVPGATSGFITNAAPGALFFRLR